jgi:hypothetical protein
MNTALSGSGRVDDIKRHPQGEIRGQTNLVKPEMRHKLAQLPFDEWSQWELSDIDGRAERPK